MTGSVNRLAPVFRVGFALVLLAGLSLAARAQANLDDWRWRSPAPDVAALSDIAFGNGLFVAVGSEGALTSESGWNWTSPSGAEGSFQVAFGNERFVAVARSGRAHVSSDGAVWTTVQTGAAELTSLTFAVNHFVAATARGGVWISSDGLGWTHAFEAPDLQLHDVTGGSGMVLAVGLSQSAPAPGVVALVSEDARHWTAVPIELDESDDAPSSQVVAAFDGSEFMVAVRTGALPNTKLWILRSQSGLEWEKSRPPDLQFADALPYALHHAGGRYYLGLSHLGWTAFVVSKDGRNWEVNGPAPPMQYVQSLAEGNGRLVAVGAGFGIGIYDVKIAVFEDGRWTRVAGSFGRFGDFTGVAHGNGRFVAVGNRPMPFPEWNEQVAVVSEDGHDWTEPLRWRASGVVATSEVRGLASNGSLFVAVGRLRHSELGDVTADSPDGLAWQVRRLGSSATLNGVTHGGGLFVAVGEGGAIFTSTSGATWIRQSVATDLPLRRAVHGGGIFAAVGGVQAGNISTPALLISTDGTNWTAPRLPEGSSALIDVAHGNDRFVALAADASVLVSPDGSNWSRAAIPESGPLTRVVFGEGVFLVGGSDIFTSPDGLAWQKRPMHPGGLLRAGVHAAGTFVLVGDQGEASSSRRVRP
jgi:hypothetical protein